MNSVPKLFSCSYADCWTEKHFSTEFGVLTPNRTHSHTLFWGCVSRWFGRALAWHARGHRFDPGNLHIKSTVLRRKYGAFLFAAAAAAVDFLIPKKTPSLLIGISCRDVHISTRRCLNNEGHLITATISFMMFSSR